jgi:hypothetical protein
LTKPKFLITTKVCDGCAHAGHLLHIVKDVVVVFRETFSIHPSIRPVIHPWMASYREKNPNRNKLPPPPPLHMCRCLGKACPAPGGGTPKILISISSSISCSSGIWGIFAISGLLPWLAICCYLKGHK